VCVKSFDLLASGLASFVARFERECITTEYQQLLFTPTTTAADVDRSAVTRLTDSAGVELQVVTAAITTTEI